MKTPVWVKLERSGNSFSGFYSTDGVKVDHDVLEPADDQYGRQRYIGLAVTSHNADAVTTADSPTSPRPAVSLDHGQRQAIGVAQPANSRRSVYVAVQDSAGKIKVVSHPDPAATTLATWQQWRIPLSEFSSAGVKMTAVKKLSIGVGDRANPKPDGAGLIFIDDIGVGHPAN